MMLHLHDIVTTVSATPDVPWFMLSHLIMNGTHLFAFLLLPLNNPDSQLLCKVLLHNCVCVLQNIYILVSDDIFNKEQFI